MGYRSDVRIITTAEGYDKLEEYVNDYLKQRNDKLKNDNLLTRCDVYKECGNYIYFGWNARKWREDDPERFPEVDAIMTGITYLVDDCMLPCSYSRMGEDFGDVEEVECVIDIKNDAIPQPIIQRYFDDGAIEDYITKYY